MSESNSKLSITLKLGSRVLPMTVDRSDEYFYREAEKLINKSFSYYASTYPNQNRDLYMLMTALDVAVRLKRLESKVDFSQMEQALSALIKEVEQALQ